MIEDAFQEYALRYLLVPGQRSLPSDVLKSAGVPQPLPVELEQLIKTGDLLNQLGVVITDADPLLRQWNPYSGVWALHTTHPFGAQLNEDHRWIVKGFEAGVRCLYDTIHEVTHGVLASLGQMGLLTRLGSGDINRFHAMSEAVAVLIGDVEGHDLLRESGYLRDYWPPSVYRSHAIALSPSEALRAAGAISTQELGELSRTASRTASDRREDRAQWLFKLNYFRML